MFPIIYKGTARGILSFLLLFDLAKIRIVSCFFIPICSKARSNRTDTSKMERNCACVTNLFVPKQCSSSVFSYFMRRTVKYACACNNIIINSAITKTCFLYKTLPHTMYSIVAACQSLYIQYKSICSFRTLYVQ